MAEMLCGEIPIYEDDFNAPIYVYLCPKCGQPLATAESTCNSGIHEGPTSDGGSVKAVRSTDLIGQQASK